MFLLVKVCLLWYVSHFDRSLAYIQYVNSTHLRLRADAVFLDSSRISIKKRRKLEPLSVISNSIFKPLSTPHPPPPHKHALHDPWGLLPLSARVIQLTFLKGQTIRRDRLEIASSIVHMKLLKWECKLFSRRQKI